MDCFQVVTTIISAIGVLGSVVFVSAIITDSMIKNHEKKYHGGK